MRGFLGFLVLISLGALGAKLLLGDSSGTERHHLEQAASRRLPASPYSSPASVPDFSEAGRSTEENQTMVKGQALKAVKSASLFLASYPNGDLIADRLLDQGLDLDLLEAPYGSEFEARQALLEELSIGAKQVEDLRNFHEGWPDSGILDQEWVSKKLHIQGSFTESQLELASVQVAEQQVDLAYKVDLYLTELQNAINLSVQNGEFDCFPYTSPNGDSSGVAPVDQDRGGAFYATGTALPSGWGGTLLLHKNDFPEANLALNAMHLAKAVRNQAIRRALGVR